MESREVASPPDDGGTGPNATPADLMEVTRSEGHSGRPPLHQDATKSARPPRQRAVLPIVIALVAVLLVALVALGPSW